MASNDKEHKVFQSSHLQAGEYDHKDQSLRLSFVNGKSYQLSIPPALWEQFRDSVSPGQFYYKHIRPHHEATEIKQEKPKPK